MVPRLSGTALEILNQFQETFPFSRILAAKFYGDSQMYVVRSFAKFLKLLPPTFYPMVGIAAEVYEYHESQSKYNFDYVVKNTTKIPPRGFQFWTIED